MIVYSDNNTNSIINIGSSCVSLKEVIVNVEFEIYQSTTPLQFLSNYNLILIGEPTKLSRPEFNSLFNKFFGIHLGTWYSVLIILLLSFF